MSIKTKATIEDLYHVSESGKAEIVNGELRLIPPTGDLPGSAAGEILVSLRAHERRTGVGRVYPGGVAFIINLPINGRSARTRPITSARVQAASSWRALRSLPWK